MYKTFLSWRYMRARRTNVIGVIGICVGVGALILILSIMSGFLEQTKKTVRGGLSDVMVQPDEPYLREGSRPLPPDALLAAVRADERVAAACAQVQSFGILLPSGSSGSVANAANTRAALTPVRLVGIDVQDEYATTHLRQWLTQVRLMRRYQVENPDDPFATPPDWKPEGLELQRVLIGQQLAERLRLVRGSRVKILTALVDERAVDTAGLAISDREFVVAGSFRSGDNEIDMGTVYFERTDLAGFMGWSQEYSQVLVKLANYDRDAEAFVPELEARLSQAGLLADDGRGQVITWEAVRAPILGAIKNERGLMAIMLSLVVVVAAFTIFAILSMMVTEKRRDIGILTALGATPRGITLLFVLIGFWDALVGATLGAILGVWGALKIDAIEAFLSGTVSSTLTWISQLFGGDEVSVQIFDRSVYFFDHIPSSVSPTWVAVIVLGAFVCTLLFALWPAWRAGRLHPLDALRYE